MDTVYFSVAVGAILLGGVAAIVFYFKNKYRDRP